MCIDHKKGYESFEFVSAIGQGFATDPNVSFSMKFAVSPEGDTWQLRETFL